MRPTFSSAKNSALFTPGSANTLLERWRSCERLEVVAFDIRLVSLELP